jgi:Metalloenzyme superfamily
MNDPGATRAPRQDRVSGPPQVILVAIDGVRPREVFEGADAELAAGQGLSDGGFGATDLMPNLHRLARTRGALLGGPSDCDSIWATGPNFVSLPGYREILTGRPAGCQENQCAPLTLDTIADDFRAVAESSREVAVISSWEGIENAASRRPESIVTSCGRRRGTNLQVLRDDAAAAALLREGEDAAPAPGTGEFRPDAITAKIALGYLVREKPRFLFLGLGEADEYGHADDYAGYLASLRAADRVIGAIDDILERTGAWKRDAIVFVTTDHGRGDDFRFHGRSVPESGRVWLLALGQRVTRPGFPPAWQTHHLTDVAPTLRVLSGLPSDPHGGAPILSLVTKGWTRSGFSHRESTPSVPEIF